MQQINPAMTSAEFLADPFPILSALRQNMPVFRLGSESGRSAWLITRFDDAVHALRDPRLSANPRSVMSTGMLEAQSGRSRVGLDRSLVSIDEPDHGRLRALVSKAFTPRYIETLRPRIQAIADDLIDQVQSRGHMDLVDDYAFPLPINVISEMLGVPKEAQTSIREWSAILAGGQLAPGTDVTAKLNEFADYLDGLIEAKRADPQDDLISQLTQIEDSGDALSHQELASMVTLLIFAGHETTSNLIGKGMFALFSYPDQLAALKADPSRIPNAIEELLRYCSPVLSTSPRFATEDFEIGGQTLHRGDQVLVVVGSGNRDLTLFTDPEELDIARQIDRHLGFGHGIHYCLGAPLARMEGFIAFETLLRRLPDIQPAIDLNEVTTRGNFVLRGIESLPVTF